MPQALRALAQLFGILAVLMGLLWVVQGTGMVMWPEESFMLAQGQWAIYGAVLASTGAIVVFLVRRAR